jgi:tetratricopeptide (TPR) repeat protein
MMAAQDAEITRGFNHFYDLEFDKSLETFRRLTVSHPDQARFHNHVAQSILYREMMRAGALESEMVTGGNSFLRREKMNPTVEAERAFHDAVQMAMTITQKRLDTGSTDLRAMYDQGVTYGLRSNWNFLVRKAWRESLKDATAGRKLHNRVTELDPSNHDARLMQGVHDYVVGSLPWHWKFLGFLAGFRGDREKGIATLQHVAAKGNVNKTDAAVLLCVVYRRERRSAEAIPLLKDLISKYPKNYLFRLEIAQMMSDLGQREESLAVLSEVERLKRIGSPGYEHLSYEKIWYYRGNLQFWYDNYDAAISNLLKVTAKASELDPNTGVMAWMRLGQSYDLRGQRTKAIEAYRHAVKYAPESEVARESEGYIREPYKRPKKS